MAKCNYFEVDEGRSFCHVEKEKKACSCAGNKAKCNFCQELEWKENKVRKEEKRFAKLVYLPYIIFCVVTVLGILTSRYGFCAMNNDVGYGMFISWVAYTFIVIFTTLFG